MKPLNTAPNPPKLPETAPKPPKPPICAPPSQQVALEVFNEHMPGPNQLYARREDVAVTAEDLLSTEGLPRGFGEGDLRMNMNVALAYMESWLR